MLLTHQRKRTYRDGSVATNEEFQSPWPLLSDTVVMIATEQKVNVEQPKAKPEVSAKSETEKIPKRRFELLRTIAKRTVRSPSKLHAVTFSHQGE